MTGNEKFIVFSVVYFVVTILLAHFFSPPGYRWTQNTISELGAQGHKYKWIMQAGFIGFGLLLNIGVVSKFVAAGRIVYPDIPIMLYGFAILMTGFLCAKPMDESLPYSHTEARWHSIFATLAGICFTVGILWYLLVSPHPYARWFHLGFLILIVGSSLLFGLAENGVVGLGKGVAQRILYISSFIWLLVGRWSSLPLV